MAASDERREKLTEVLEEIKKQPHGLEEFSYDPVGYLKRKGIQSHGARLHKDGRLLLPVFNADGEIQSLQFIPNDGKAKRFLPDACMKGGRLILGKPAEGVPIILAEGFATAASIREATGYVVVVGFSGSNLASVAADLERPHANALLIIAGDLDASGMGAKYSR